ncbi:MAG: hypothetical protein ACFHW5_02700 [Verrucomicrobiota bacterium]|jgi:hypothetical protein
MSGNSHPTEKGKKLQTLTLIEELNGGYVCPPVARPAWRAAYEAGVDMALLEEKLAMTPAERLEAHHKAINRILALRDSMIQGNETMGREHDLIAVRQLKAIR